MATSEKKLPADYPRAEWTEGFAEEVAFMEAVTVTDRAEARRLLIEQHGLKPDETNVGHVHMRLVAVSEPYWVECPADHPDAFPFWRDDPYTNWETPDAN